MEIKPCTKCGKEKPHTTEFFYKSGKSLRSDCKPCTKQYREDNKERRAEYNKQHYQDNKEHYKQYYQDNKERKAELNKQYREDNKERIAEKKKQYREDNKERIAKQKKQYRQDNKEYLAEYFRQYLQDNREKKYAHNAKRRAAKLKVTTENFTRQDVLDKWGTDCHICSDPIDLDNWHMDHVIPLQPKEGEPGTHTLDNVKPSHPHCNMSKSNKYETL